MREDDFDGQRWPTYPGLDQEFAEVEDQMRRSRRRSDERFRRHMADPTISDESKAELRRQRAKQRELQHAMDEWSDDVADDELPPLRTTDDVEPAGDDDREETREPWFNRHMDRKIAESELGGDEDELVRGPRRPGAAGRSLTGAAQLAKGWVGGIAVAAVVWALACWGLSSLFGWYIWGVGLMVGAAVPIGLVLLTWFGMCWSDVREYIRSGGPAPVAYRRR